MPKRILIVEDEPLSRKNIGLFLREVGYEIDEAKDGVEALNLIDSFKFDLVLSDLRMPRVDGIAVISHLRSISPDTPFIVLTAYAADAVYLSKMPRAVFMNKPVVLEDLRVKIRRLLEW
jgi:CheY-like chemotaxis protein